MGIEEIIKKRRSIRKYLSQPVSNEEIIRLLESAVWAPTACNRQDYYFIIVDDESLLKRMFDAGGSKLLLESDKVLFVLYSSLTDNLEYADHIQSASAVIENFLLLACEAGIGTCWICHLPRKKELSRLLNITCGIEVIAAVSLGYADFGCLTTVKRKHAVKEVLGINSFYSGKSETAGKKSVFTKRILIKVYYMLPNFLKRGISSFVDSHLVKKFKN